MKAGTSPSIDALRAQGGIANAAAAVDPGEERFRDTKADGGARHRARARAGIRSDRQVALLSRSKGSRVDEALARAYANRSDYQAALCRREGDGIFAKGRGGGLLPVHFICGRLRRCGRPPFVEPRSVRRARHGERSDFPGRPRSWRRAGGGSAIAAKPRSRWKTCARRSIQTCARRYSTCSLPPSRCRWPEATSTWRQQTLTQSHRSVRGGRDGYGGSGAVAGNRCERQRAVHLEPLQLSITPKFRSPGRSDWPKRASNNTSKENSHGTTNERGSAAQSSERRKPAAGTETHSASPPPSSAAQNALHRNPAARRFAVVVVIVAARGRLLRVALFHELRKHGRRAGGRPPDAAERTHLRIHRESERGRQPVRDRRNGARGNRSEGLSGGAGSGAGESGRCGGQAQSLGISVPITSISTTSQTSATEADVENAKRGNFRRATAV